MMRIKAGDGCMPRPPLIKQTLREGGDGVGVHGGVGIGCVYMGHEIPLLLPNDIALLDI